MKINKGELIVPGIMAAFLAAYFYQVWADEVPADVLTWPIYVGAALAVCLLLVAVLYIPQRGEAAKAAVNVSAFKKPVALLIMTAVYIAAMNWIGYTLGSFLFLLVVQIYLGSGWRRALLVALVVAALLHVVMVELIGLGVPRLTTPWLTL